MKIPLWNDNQDLRMNVCPISLANASGEKECIGEKCLLFISHPIEV